MNEHLRTATSATRAAGSKIFQLCAGLDRDNQKRRHTGSPHEIHERTISGDELMPHKSAFKNLFRLFTARSRCWNVDREIANLDGICDCLQRDVPIQRRAVSFESLRNFEW